MSFDSWRDFLAMGGHGLYVWLSYGAALIIVCWNVLAVRLGVRRQVRRMRDWQRRQKGAGAAASNLTIHSGEPDHR